MTGRPRKKSLLIRIVLAVAAPLFLASCDWTPDGELVAPLNGALQGGATVDRLHPLLVNSEKTRFLVKLSDEGSGVERFDAAVLSDFDAFLDGFVEQGYGRMDLAVPLEDGDTQGLMADTEIVVRYAVGRGVRSGKLNVFAAPADQPADTIVLSYLRTSVTLPDCPDWSTRPTHNPRNVAYPNQGCASQRNLGVMVADPADLVAPKRLPDRDPTRTTGVVRAYRAGEPTQADIGAIGETGTTDVGQ